MDLTPETVTIAVGTYGDPSWQRLAERRAIPSGQAQGCRVVHAHADTLHHARNAALAQVTTPWVIHLDADDELEPGYVAGMATTTGDVRVPMVRYVQHRRPLARPRFPNVAGHTHECTGPCLLYGNWIVVGAGARTDLVRGIGGWRDFTWSEDWDVWLRCYLTDATFGRAIQSVYRAHVRPGSRNRAGTGEQHLAVHRAIAEANGGAEKGIPVP